ncbi:hypothetical protein HanPSC8_Chr10g0433021 [Helianthus annuus]|nr:hypothetical protein HanPSC8_Chr10g0433021 [Helianthus annuus]
MCSIRVRVFRPRRMVVVWVGSPWVVRWSESEDVAVGGLEVGFGVADV